VNINYRLSIFGFAASSEIIEGQADGALRGCNFAIRDQKVGLKWVSQNIAAFGGDPTKITIGGQSAGGSSVHAHVLEAKLKAERPLFRNACIQSGAVGTLGPISMAQAEESWEKLCQHFGIQKTEGRSRIDSFQNITTEALVQATRDLCWGTCALVEDKLTLTVTGKIGDYGIPFVLDFGEGSSNHVADTHTNGIQILIGDTEKDVSTPFFIKPVTNNLKYLKGERIQ
jgi:carboxylesterase type B